MGVRLVPRIVNGRPSRIQNAYSWDAAMDSAVFAPRKLRMPPSAEYPTIQKITPITTAVVMAEPMALPILSDSRFPMQSDR